MKKVLIIIITTIIIISALGGIFFLVDHNRVMNNKRPIFCLNLSGTILDGGTVILHGLGYKVIDFNTITGFDDIKIGSWLMEYDDFYDEIKEYEKNLWENI